MSKGYTINYFITTLKNTSTSMVAKKGVYNVIAPRYGALSLKANALNIWLNGETFAIVKGVGKFASYGKTARTRLLTALKNRKNTGTV